MRLDGIRRRRQPSDRFDGRGDRLRIAVVAPNAQVNSNYRAIPLAHLERRGHRVDLMLAAVDRESLVRYDVVHFYRYSDRTTRELAKHLRRHGVGIVWDNDDDMTRGADGKHRAMRSQEALRDIRGMLRLAHVVTTPSHLLAAHYRGWEADNVAVIDNFLPDWFSHARRSPAEGPVCVGWIAAQEHRADDAALGLTNVLAGMLARHPQVSLQTVGVRLSISDDRYTYTRQVDFDQLPAQIARFDVGIAPLADTEFNRARSSVKLKEYASCGAAWLASPIGPYLGLGEKQGGVLVADGGWPAALDRLIADARTRRKLAANGAKWAREETIGRDANLARWEQVMLQARELARANVASVS